MPLLKFTGDYYRGDGLWLDGPQEVDVHQDKADQLLRDFPHEWALATQEGVILESKVVAPEEVEAPAEAPVEQPVEEVEEAPEAPEAPVEDAKSRKK